MPRCDAPRAWYNGPTVGFTLAVVVGPYAGAQYALDDDGHHLVGADEDVCIQLGEPGGTVAPLHAALEVRNGRVRVRDLADRGTTRVNGASVTTAELEVGDTLTIGESELRLERNLKPSRPSDALTDAERRELRASASMNHADVRDLAPLKCDRCHRVGIQPPRRDLESASWLCPECIAANTRLEPHEPRNLGHFRIMRHLAAGGMGTVFDGVEGVSGIRAAIKVITLEPRPSERAILRFLREQRIARTLSHPNIVRCYEVGTEKGRPFIAMEFVAGGDAQSLASMQSNPYVVMRLGADLFDALAYAHQHGVVHRDVKPANLLLTAPGATGHPRGKLTDFGLAKGVRSTGSQAITHAGEAGGSLLLASPEQLLGFTTVGPSGDLYSGGATIFRMLTADTHLVLSKSVRDARMHEVAGAVLQPIRKSLASFRPDLPAALIQLVDQLVAHDERHRKALTPSGIASTLRQLAYATANRPTVA